MEHDATPGHGRHRAMPGFICTACGTQFVPNEVAPQSCAICQDDRQFVPPDGQRWTTLEALGKNHVNAYREYEPGLIGIGTYPRFAIGQRALLVCTPHGNVLWDTVALLDRATMTLINGLGGLKAIGISHPHFYTTMVEWSRAFGSVPIYLHAADRRWIMRPDPAVRLWEGETLALLEGVTLIRCGGHFPGGNVLHWADGAGGRGVLCASDIAMVAMDRASVSFMHSYPNLVPLSARQVTGIATALEPFEFERIYGIFFDLVIAAAGKQRLKASVDRYVAAISGTASTS
jgi:hypothetical protein